MFQKFGLFHSKSDTDKIDRKAVQGLLGTPDSLAYIADEVHKHFHNNEYWFGPDGANSISRTTANFWGLTAGTSFGWGTEALVHDGSDPGLGWVKMDVRKMLIKGVTAVNTLYTIQWWEGSGTFGEATYVSEDEIYFPAAAKSDPVEIMTPRVAVTQKVWHRIRCETNGASLDIRYGIHGYIG